LADQLEIKRLKLYDCLDAGEQTQVMPIRIVRLGSPRLANEGPRLGTVRRPPRGVPKAEYSARDFYDVWLPSLSPSQGVIKAWLAAPDDKVWPAFQRKFRAELRDSGADRTLDLLAALSHTAAFSLGCYCEDEHRCHRSILRDLLAERGASFSSK